MSEIETFDPQAPAFPEVGDAGLEQMMKQAQALDAALKIGTALAGTEMVPQTYRGKPETAAAAILYGAELGLKPTQALQQVFVVHGQPAIYARTMVALLKSKGYKFETVDSTDTAVTVRGTAPSGEVEESTWTLERAKKAGYTSNKKYQTDPQAMLYAKAASEVSRKLAPDVLMGIRYTAEDLELERPRIKYEAKVERPGRGSSGLRAALGQAPDQDEAPAAADAGQVEADAVDEPSELLQIASAEVQGLDDRELIADVLKSYQADLDESEFEVLRELGTTRWRELGAVDSDA